MISSVEKNGLRHFAQLYTRILPVENIAALLDDSEPLFVILYLVQAMLDLERDPPHEVDGRASHSQGYEHGGIRRHLLVQ
jgi:hypothetical protein